MKEILLATKRLAVSESGFVFDPVSGQSFTVNATGLEVLRLTQHQDDVEQIAAQLTDEFDASNAEIKRDVQDFMHRLQGFLK